MHTAHGGHGWGKVKLKTFSESMYINCYIWCPYIGGCYSRADSLRHCIKIWVSFYQKIFRLFSNFFYFASGLAGGEENGRRGYRMTFAIAYVRVRRDDVMITILRIILCCYYRIWGLIIAIFQSRLKLQLLGAGDYILSTSLPLLLLCLFSPLSLLFFPLSLLFLSEC